MVPNHPRSAPHGAGLLHHPVGHWQSECEFLWPILLALACRYSTIYHVAKAAMLPLCLFGFEETYANSERSLHPGSGSLPVLPPPGRAAQPHAQEPHSSPFPVSHGVYAGRPRTRRYVASCGMVESMTETELNENKIPRTVKCDECGQATEVPEDMDLTDEPMDCAICGSDATVW